MKISNTNYAPDAPHFYYSHEGAEILVLGTAHVSRQSVEDVEESFKKFRPDSVCVELCQPRHDALRDPNRWRKLDLAQLIREKKLGLLASSLALSSFQKKIGALSGVKPGAEMLRAVELAEENETELVLADREVRATLLRAWHRVGFFSRLWLASALMSSLLVTEEVSPEEIEKLKHEDVLSDMFSNLPARYNSVKKVIIDERDNYLAEKIHRAALELKEKKKRGKRRILAVVGAGHLAGIERALIAEERADLEELDRLPPRKRLKNLASWIGLSLFAGALGYYFSEKNPKDAWNLFAFWVACRSIGSGLGAIISRAHPLTVLATAAIAPFSIVIIGSRLWMYSALTELWFKKPRVEDFENIAAQTENFRGFLKALYANRVLHLFFIIFAVSWGLTIGNLVFGLDVAREIISAL